jgi:hypothetical protein
MTMLVVLLMSMRTATRTCWNGFMGRRESTGRLSGSMAVRGKIRFVLAKVLRMLVVVRLIERRDRSIQRGVLSHQFVRPTLEASVLVDLALGHAVACYAYLSGDTTDSENASC